MAKRKTHEEFVEEVFNLVGNEYEFITKYINSRTEIIVRHKVCDHVWNIIPSSLLKGLNNHKGEYVCPNCNNPRKTTEQFKKEVYSMVGNEFEVKSEYINTHTNIKMRHITCCHEFFVHPSNFIRDKSCPECSKEINAIKRRKTNDQFKQEVMEIRGDNYDFLTDYVGSDTKVRIRHRECGYEWECSPCNLTKKSQKGKLYCPNCNGGVSHDIDKFKEKVCELVGNEYLVLGDYINAKTPIRMIHNVEDCMYEYTVNPNDFTSSECRCPKCSGRARTTEES